MPEEFPDSVHLPLIDKRGVTHAWLQIWPTGSNGKEYSNLAPLMWLDQTEAAQASEQVIQLLERERYEYEISNCKDSKEPKEKLPSDLRLKQVRGIKSSRRDKLAGTIETGDFCGTLSLYLENSTTHEIHAVGMVEVRSKKVDYRQHYRTMLTKIGERSAALLMDHNSPTSNTLSSDWNDQSAPLIQQQLEFLRDLLNSDRFTLAIEQILHQPHYRIQHRDELVSTNRLKKVDRHAVRQLLKGGGTRQSVPSSHALYNKGIKDLPSRIFVPVGMDDYDTAENRFIKSILTEFHDFVSSLLSQVTSNDVLMRDLNAMKLCLDSHLRHSFFSTLSRPTSLPFGSPVLQRKAGYRELYHLWLQFHAAAQLQWDGGNEIWKSGARNVASLYEYWLFFTLEELFRTKFQCEQPLHKLIVETEKATGITKMNLKRGIQLETPIEGVWSETTGRRLKAQFQFNKKFTVDADNKSQSSSSWTRGVQPDYTISIWPADFTAEDAEKFELMVHVHFDAKYRVENLQGFTSKPTSEEGDDTSIHGGLEQDSTSGATAAKYGDLLKMHAYRDAIRRTGGAYVLYPGDSQKEPFRQFHEVLPGLGAFAVRPGSNREVLGIDAVSDFLDRIVEHLSNRTTAYERSRYHKHESYSLEEEPVEYNALSLSEKFTHNEDLPASPPEDHMVLTAWYDGEPQLEWTKSKGIAIVRLGKRTGSFHVPPEIAATQHILFRTKSNAVTGLWKLTEPGFKVYTGDELASHHKYKSARTENDYIYAVFSVQEDVHFESCSWDNDKLLGVIKSFEERNKSKSLKTLGHTSAYPRILSLRELLKASYSSIK